MHGSVAQLSTSFRTTGESSVHLESFLGALDTNPYGLEILHPKSQPEKRVQIIFVHGLGGSKRGTWTDSKGKFWPSWLGEEAGFENVRTVLYGYRANINPWGPNTNSSIQTFANQLLDQMDKLSFRYGSVFIHVLWR